MWENPKRIETAIKRFTREIAEIDECFYNLDQNAKADRHLYAGMLERKRDDVIRAAVVQMHTAIEDLLNQIIMSRLLGFTRQKKSRSQSARALEKMLTGGGSMGFDMKLTFAFALRIIDAKTKARLGVLNTLRNKCSHNWVLNVPVRRGRRPSEKKPPLLSYDGHNLHSVEAFKDFVSEFGGIYLKFYMKAP